MLVLLLVVMVFMVVVRVMDSSVYLSCDQMGSVTEVGRVHSIWQLRHLERIRDLECELVFVSQSTSHPAALWGICMKWKLPW